MSEWSDLPNAGHIDWVLESVRTHPQEWAEAWDAAWDAVRSAAVNAAWHAVLDATRDASRDAAWHAVLNAVLNATRDAALDAARDTARGEACRVAWGAIAALVAYDHAGKYLGMPSDQVRLWATLSEDPAAILMLSAVILRERIERAAHNSVTVEL